jgi:hypothetical protein
MQPACDDGVRLASSSKVWSGSCMPLSQRYLAGCDFPSGLFPTVPALDHATRGVTGMLALQAQLRLPAEASKGLNGARSR